MNPYPFGLQFPNERYYYDDKYRDQHPVFNISVLNKISLELNEKELVEILKPENVFYSTNIKANFSFYNENIQKEIKNINFRVKGRASRKYINIKLIKILDEKLGIRFTR
jgi:hypothetical protein